MDNSLSFASKYTNTSSSETTSSLACNATATLKKDDEEALLKGILSSSPDSFAVRTFEVMCFLGKGAFGSVLKVRSKENGGMYALKRIRFVGNTDIVLRECRSHALLDHWNVVRYERSWIEADTSDTANLGGKKYVLYIQMELCEGSLAQWIANTHRRINEAKNMSIFYQIVAGLNHLHSQGIIHRDLKPANIFLSSNGEIKIGDLGISKHLNNLQEATHEAEQVRSEDESPFHTMRIGTKGYASPEQIESGLYTEKTDIYSLGIILFELFNVFANQGERAAALQELRLGIATASMVSNFPDVVRLILQMMDPEPDNRPSSSLLLASCPEIRS